MIEVPLPLTEHLSRVRVKEREDSLSVGMPVATRKKALTTKHYIEWQISYSTEEQDKSPYPSIYYQVNGKKRYAYELTAYLWQLIRQKDFTQAAFQDLCTHILSIDTAQTIERKFAVTRNSKGSYELYGMEFALYIEKNSILIYLDDAGYSIECSFRHRQNAVGYQIMLYLCLPLSKCKEHLDLMGRSAQVKEHAMFNLSPELLCRCIKVFAMCSPSHYQDIRALLSCMARQQGLGHLLRVD